MKIQKQLQAYSSLIGLVDRDICTQFWSNYEKLGALFCLADIAVVPHCISGRNGPITMYKNGRKTEDLIFDWPFKWFFWCLQVEGLCARLRLVRGIVTVTPAKRVQGLASAPELQVGWQYTAAISSNYLNIYEEAVVRDSRLQCADESLLLVSLPVF